jgi:CrcB protein
MDGIVSSNRIIGEPMKWLIDVFLLGLAGAIGTLIRAGCQTLAIRLFGDAFPWGTMFVNIAGSFAFGAIYSLIRSRALISTEHEAVLLVGLLGGITTYSSFAFQSTEMLASGRMLTAAAYILATNLAGIAAVWAGMRLFS